MNINFQALSRSLGDNLGPLAPVLLVAAAAAVWVTALSVKTAATGVHRADDRQNTQQVHLERTQITAQQALAAAQRLTKLSPATTVAVNGSNVVVSISSPEQFAEWVHALTELQSTSKDVQWEPVDMCIASCEGGEPAKAYVTGYRRRIKVG